MEQLLSSRDELIGVLHHLVETAQDGESGFRLAADHARSPVLQQRFLTMATDCADSVYELQKLIKQLGTAAPRNGTACGSANQGWLWISDRRSVGGDPTLLEFCERGAQQALGRYREELERELPAEMRQVVQRQLDGLVRNYELVRGLRMQYALSARGG